MRIRTQRLLWAGAAVLVLLCLGGAFWVRRFHRYTPLEAMRDLQAAAQVRNAPKPVERFLELRYGSMAEPANRQRAFLDFFNIGHIEGLNMIVSRIPGEKKQAHINAMAQWVADYRRSLSAEERAALRNYLGSEAGRATLQQATAQYLQKDVRFRASTAPVIQELMTTVSTVQKP